MSVFNSWAPADVFGENSISNNNSNNRQSSNKINQRLSKDLSTSLSIKAFDNWSPEAIFGGSMNL